MKAEITDDILSILVERERSAQLMDEYWRIRDVLNCFAEARSIVNKAWSEAARELHSRFDLETGEWRRLNGEQSKQFARLSAAVDNHFAQEILRAVGR